MIEIYTPLAILPRAWPVAALLFAALLTACKPVAQVTPTPGVLEQAAEEATAIVERAEATAMVLSARATANAMLLNAAGATQVLPANPVAAATQLQASPATTPQVAGALLPAGAQETTSDPVRILSAGFAAEGAYIHVQFAAPPEVAGKWTQGLIYIVEESTGTEYREIPVAPVIGMLLSKPIRDGQPGYVMLVNTDRSLQAGSMVTVVLGSYRFEHILIEK